MNSKLSWLALRLALTLLLLVLAIGSLGCKANRGTWSLLVKETNVVENVTRSPAVTNTFTVVTNAVNQVNGTTVTNWITNLVHAITPGYEITNLVTNVVFLPNPRIENLVGGAKTVNEIANPTPFAPVVNAVLGLSTIALGWFARLKTRQAQENSGMLSAVIQGVELAKSPEVKAHIATIAKASGVEDKLHNLVKKST